MQVGKVVKRVASNNAFVKAVVSLPFILLLNFPGQLAAESTFCPSTRASVSLQSLPGLLCWAHRALVIPGFSKSQVGHLLADPATLVFGA